MGTSSEQFYSHAGSVCVILFVEELKGQIFPAVSFLLYLERKVIEGRLQMGPQLWGSFQNKPSIIVFVLSGSSTELKGTNGVLLCTSIVRPLLLHRTFDPHTSVVIPGLA